MADVDGQSTNRERAVDGLYVNSNIVSSYYDTTGEALTAKTVGYAKTFTVNVGNLGLGSSVTDIDVWLHEITSAGGGVDNYDFIKLPFSRYLDDGTVYDSAYYNVKYQANTPKGPDSAFTGSAILEIVYTNNVTATGYPTFYYHVSNRGILG